MAGCGNDGSSVPVATPTTSGTTRPPAPSSTAPAATSEGAPAQAAGTARSTGDASGAGLVLTDVRVGAAEGVDRIVLEFSGTGTPGWVVNYVDEAVLDGSGDVVDLDGAAVLDIYATGTTAPAPDYYSGPKHLAPQTGGAVSDAYVAGTFEGYTQVLAGISSDRLPFRVFALRAPARLVVDVVDEED